MNSVRVIAVAVIWRGSDLFVFRGYDSRKGSHFYRPLGGAVEFGEHSSQTVRREFLEEVGAELLGVRHLFTLENIFHFRDALGHEVVQVYEAAFADGSFYEREELEAAEHDGAPFTALWKGLDSFSETERLAPEGLLGKLRGG